MIKHLGMDNSELLDLAYSIIQQLRDAEHNNDCTIEPIIDVYSLLDRLEQVLKQVQA